MIKKIFFIVFILLSGLTYSQTGRFVVKSVSINSSDNEFGTVISKDGGVYYSKSNAGGSSLNELSASLYRGELLLKGDISKGLKFPSDATYAVFTKDGRTVYYSKKEGSKFQLYKAYVDETGRWKDNVKLPFNDPNYTFKQPALNQENTKLFFVSDKADSYGSTDIYYVSITNHGLDYSEPKHLNFYVNSPGEEGFPHLGEKDKLYFSSNGMNGLGGLDVFESFFNNGDYEKTSNLGEPINSEYDDFAYTLISDNHKGFFSSNRKGGKGGIDIYFFEDYKPTLNNCSETIKGYVKNKENQKPIFEAIVEIFDSKGNNENTLTDKDGSFLIENVECEVTYDIVSYKEGFNGFAEVHVIPKNAETINLYLNPEFPEGYKEEFDFSNEIVVIDTKTNKEIIPEKNDGYDALKAKSQAKDSQVSEEQKALIAEAQQTSNQLKNNPQKQVAQEEWDPLDYDPHSQPKKAVVNTTTSEKKQEPENTKKEVAQTEYWDPLDYDPHTVRKNNIEKSVTVNDNTEEQTTATQNTQTVDYDPLDYDPHTQSKNQPKKEVATVDPIEEARLKREAAEQERQKMIAEAKATSSNLKNEQETKKLEEAKIAEANRLEKEKALALQKQAIADAKKRDEEERLEQTRLAEANIQKAKQAEADRIEAEKQEKIRLEAERQAAIVAKKQAAEQERQQMIAEAKATSEQLKREQEAQQLAQAQEAEAKKQEAEKTLAKQNQLLADAKKRDQEANNVAVNNQQTFVEKTTSQEEYHTVQKGEGLYSIAKNNNMTVEELKELNGLTSNTINVGQKLIVTKADTEIVSNSNKDVVADNSVKELTQKEKMEQERQQMIAEAKATSEQLKREQEAQQLAQAQEAEAKKQEAEKTLAKQNQILADAKKRDQEANNVAVNNQQTFVEKTTSQEQYHTVQKGEGLYSIAKNNNMTVEELKELNGLTSNTINVGQKLIVTKADTEIVSNSNKDVVADNSVKELTQKEKMEQERQQMIAEAKATSEQLKREQEAQQLAQAQEAEAKKQEAEKTLVKQNQLLADAKKRDQEANNVAVNNKQTFVEKTTSQEEYHTVQKGEGLYSIAKNNNMTVEELKELNGLTSNTIYSGQKLLVTKPNENIVSHQVKENPIVQKETTENKTLTSTQLKQQQEEQARLDRIAKAKATAEQLRKEKEQNQLAQTDIKKAQSEKITAKNEPEEGSCAKNINGYIKNSLNKKVLGQVRIDMYFEGQNIESTTTNASGEFFFNNVDCDTKYTLICYKEGFQNIAKAVVDTKYDPKDVTILLDPTSTDGAVAVNQKVPDTVTKTTQSQQNNSIAQNQKVQPKTTTVTTTQTKKSQNLDEDDGMTYYVEPEKVEVPKIEEGKVVLNPIYFDLDEWYLTVPARKELDRIILLLKMNPTMVIESGSHTDTRGNFDYNLTLSEKRSQETVGYMIANGADPDRISGRGYGETMPVNHCLDGVKCTEKEHLQNRRTEFVILKY